MALSYVLLVSQVVSRDSDERRKGMLVVDPVESVVLPDEVVIDYKVFRSLGETTIAVLVSIPLDCSEVGAM